MCGVQTRHRNSHRLFESYAEPPLLTTYLWRHPCPSTIFMSTAPTNTNSNTRRTRASVSRNMSPSSPRCFRRAVQSSATKAETLDREAGKAEEQSERLLAPHHRLAESMTFIQIAIALASITMLTRKRWLFSVAGIAATVGVALWGMAFIT